MLMADKNTPTYDLDSIKKTFNHPRMLYENANEL